jgi:glutamate synthase (NADPH/NADH) small chain
MGREVAVIGGGNTAMDAVRTARRLGAERALLIYRRSRAEMPARAEEVEHAEQEGIEFLFQTNPVRVLGTPEGVVCGIECQAMTMGEPDASGRRRPVPVPGSERVIDLQTVIVAVGQRPNPIVQSTTSGLDTGRHGVVAVDEAQRTSRPGVFAGGDLSRGGATVILAMRDGRRAAAAIHEQLAR